MNSCSLFFQIWSVLFSCSILYQFKRRPIMNEFYTPFEQLADQVQTGRHNKGNGRLTRLIIIGTFICAALIWIRPLIVNAASWPSCSQDVAGSVTGSWGQEVAYYHLDMFQSWVHGRGGGWITNVKKSSVLQHVRQYDYHRIRRSLSFTVHWRERNAYSSKRVHKSFKCQTRFPLPIEDPDAGSF